MNAKISVFVICIEAMIYVLLYNLHDVLMYEETICWESKEVLFKKE